MSKQTSDRERESETCLQSCAYEQRVRKLFVSPRMQQRRRQSRWQRSSLMGQTVSWEEKIRRSFNCVLVGLSCLCCTSKKLSRSPQLLHSHSLWGALALFLRCAVAVFDVVVIVVDVVLPNMKKCILSTFSSVCGCCCCCCWL